MKRICLAGLAVVLGCAVQAWALDRDARVIDTAALNVANLNDADSIGGMIWAENAFAVPGNDWAVLLGVGFDRISPDGADDLEAWTGALGLKYYVLPETSVSLAGSYTRYSTSDDSADRDAKALTLGVKQYLLAADSPVAPFVRGAATWRDRSTFTDYDPAAEEDSISEFLVAVSGGAEFTVRSDLTFVFEAGYAVADASDDDSEDLDGFFASVAMRYFFTAADGK